MRLYTIRAEKRQWMHQECRDVPSARLHVRRRIQKHQMLPGKTSDDTGKIIRPFPQLHTMSRRRTSATSLHDYHHKIKMDVHGM